MLPYKTDIDSTRKWTIDKDGSYKISYTFDKGFNISGFANILTREKLTVSDINYGDESSWDYAMQEVMKVTNVQFESSTASSAQLGLLTGTVSGVSGGVGMRNDPQAGSITRGVGIVETGQSNYTYIHELLHTLGLDHPGHLSGANPNFAHYTRDSSIMRYENSNIKEYTDGRDIVTPMVYDIALLQQKYGVKYGAIDQSYTAKGDKEIASTLWLGGGRGENHIDASSVTENAPYHPDNKSYNKIDLRGGFDENDVPRFSQVGREVFSLALDPDKKWEKPIEIENATGSKTIENFIIGNAADNVLIGGNKRDTIIGGGGESVQELLKGNEDQDILVADNSYAKRRFGIDFSDNTDITYNPEKQNISSLYCGLSCIKQKIMQSSQTFN